MYIWLTSPLYSPPPFQIHSQLQQLSELDFTPPSKKAMFPADGKLLGYLSQQGLTISP